MDPYLSVPDPTRPFHRDIPVPFDPESVRTATAVLSTHEHNDHCDPRTLRALGEHTGAAFFGPISSAKKAKANGFPDSRVIMVSPKETHRISPSFRLTVFSAHDPYEEHAVTYVIGTPRGNIFHSGDTSYFDGFRIVGKETSVEVALLNFGKQIPDPSKPYYMDAASVARAASDLRAKIVVPMHWNLWVEGKDDPTKVKAELMKISAPPLYRTIKMGGVLEL